MASRRKVESPAMSSERSNEFGSTDQRRSGARSSTSGSRVTVSCRMRPLLPSEVEKGVTRAQWILTDRSISLAERAIGRQSLDEALTTATSKTRSEVRALDHLRRDDGETVMDNVFGEACTTQQVYDGAFRGIVSGVAEGLNGAIIAYGQTSSGKTYSISGSTAKHEDADDSHGEKGIIHFALEDLFSKLREKAACQDGTEFLVRMSYCELYMERVNDLLRKIGPQSQNLPVKEDPEGRGFYAEGLKEKCVASAEEVVSLLLQAEKRRKVAYTRFNEVSSRSHTILTLCVECSTPLEATADLDAIDAPRLTRLGRLVIVDLAGNEKVEAGTEYMAESNSINKSLFFLGKVIEKLSQRDRRSSATTGNAFEDAGEHVPFRDSKLTRLLSVHLGGNSQTGMLVTLTPAEDAVEQSMTTLRFAQKASLVRCVAKPVLVSKEQSLIVKQRELIAQLHSQVKSLQEEAQQRTFNQPSKHAEDELNHERKERVEELQALVVSSNTSDRQAFVSKSREVDAVVTALHKNNDALRKQKATIIENMRDFYKAVGEVARSTAEAASLLQSSTADAGRAALQVLDQSSLSVAGSSSSTTGGSASAWLPAIQDLQSKLKALLQASLSSMQGNQDLSSKLSEALKENESFRQAAKAQAASVAQGASSEARQLREENSRLRQTVKFMTEERERLKVELETFQRQLMESSERQALESRQASSASPATSSIAPSARPISEVDGFEACNNFQWSRRPPPAKVAEVCARSASEFTESTSPGPSSAPCVGTAPTSSSSSVVAGQHTFERLDMQSLSSTGLFDFEPIIERSKPTTASPPTATKQVGTFFGNSPLQRSGSMILSKTGSLGEFEPIIERCPSVLQVNTAEPSSLSSQRQTDLRPPLPTDSTKLSVQAYYQQLSAGAKQRQPKWSPGDTAFWRGQACKVIRAIPEDQPLCVTLRTPRGAEVTTDACLLSEVSAVAPSPADAAAGASRLPQPRSLARLGDLLLERPLPSAAEIRPNLVASPRTFSHGALRMGSADRARSLLAPSSSRPSSREPLVPRGRSSYGPVQSATFTDFRPCQATD